MQMHISTFQAAHDRQPLKRLRTLECLLVTQRSLYGLSLGVVELKELYRTMRRMRRFEEGIADLYYSGKVPSSAHLYIGQEAVGAGVCQNLRKSDYMLTTHRGHGHNVAKGVSMKSLAAEILGKATGLCGGKGGSMRATSFQDGAVYSCSIVGSSVPIAAGVGLSIKMRGTDQVVACFFGEGAVNIGDFHEGINLAALWNLPVVYVCENNLYALSVSQQRSTLAKDVVTRAASYGVPGEVIDGNNVLAVYEASKRAIDRARHAKGPTLLECRTYRWLGHHAGDPGLDYRTKEEVDGWKKRCPVLGFRRLLAEVGVTTEELEGIESSIDSEVAQAMAYAVESPYPGPEQLMKDVI